MSAIQILGPILLAALGQPAGPTRSEILVAIREVESGSREDCPDGDGGRAIGPFQIHRRYWLDAVESDPSIGGRYEDCRDRAYAEKVVIAFLKRHAPAAWRAADAETMARIHNGGPKGASKEATRAYWVKVRKALGRLQATGLRPQDEGKP
jgi:hypothetical protein